MEKHLLTVLTEISQKELEIDKIKAEIESMKPTDYTNGDVAITCGQCHQGNHTKRCVDPPCTTSISCGKIRFHKSELKVVENKKVQLKKLICDKVSLESESMKIRETIASIVKMFPQAVKTALINSNKKEYVTIHEGKFVPLTTRINRDISILQKYYNGRIPSDIEQESSLFPTIIAEANKRFQLNSFTVEQKLEETLSSVHRCITVNSRPINESNCITVDSSPEINTCTNQRTTNPSDISSPVSIIGDGMFPNDTLNSPPSKLSKPSANGSCHNSGLDHVVANFQKLDSPSKDTSTDKQPSPFTTNACTIPVDTSMSNLNVAVSCSPLNTPGTDTALFRNASIMGDSQAHGICGKSTDKLTPDVVRQPPTPSYYPYLYPPPHPQPYPYAIIPPIHSPYNITTPSTKTSLPQHENWLFSQFNRVTSSTVSKPSDACTDQTSFYPADIKPRFQALNFGMALTHSPFPWYPNSNTSGAIPFFSHPNDPSTSSGNKNLTSVKSELKPPCITEITSSLGKTENCTPVSSVHVDASPEEHVDVVTILPQECHSSEFVTGSRKCDESVNKLSVDYSTHFELGNKNQPIKIGTILPNDQKSQGQSFQPSSV